jgi:hypothetical protein
VCVDDLKHESDAYHRLRPLQGKYVPVHLEDVAVGGELYYAGAVRIVHMLLLSFEEFPLRSSITQTFTPFVVLRQYIAMEWFRMT